MMQNRKNDRPLFFSPKAIEVGVTPSGEVSVNLGKPHPDLGFAPDIVLALTLSPSDSRSIGELLIRKAHEAEGSRVRH